MPTPTSHPYSNPWFTEIQAYFNELVEGAKTIDPKDVKRLAAEVSQLKESLEKRLSEPVSQENNDEKA